MKLERVALRQVDFADRRFAFSRAGDLSPLIASIRAVGVLDPPELLAERDRHVVVRGYRRLLALRALRRRGVEARVFRAGELTGLELWQRAFHDTVSRRPLDAAEACLAVRQVLELGLAPAAAAQLVLGAAGLPPRPAAVEQCRRVAALGDRFLDALGAGRFTWQTAVWIAALPEPDRAAALGFLRTRPLTASQQREWVRLAADLAAIAGRPLRVVLAAARRARGRPGHPGEAALQAMRERRNPAVARDRRRFARLVAGLRLPRSVAVEAHPFFESPGLSVRIGARTAQELEAALEKLRELGRPSLFRRLERTPFPRK